MLKLYFGINTRSIWTRFLLEEAGAKYELVKLNPREGDREKMNYSAIHPLGQFPAIQDGDTPIFESGAIAAYIADKFPTANLAPAVGSVERGLYYQWLFYPVATLEQAMRKALQAKYKLDPESPQAKALFNEAREDFKRFSAPIENQLKKGPFILGEKFSAADAMISAGGGFAKHVGLLEENSAYDNYVKKIQARPAFQRALKD
jgi:glutathione S-transferase